VREITIQLGEYVDDERRRRRRAQLIAGVAVFAALLVTAIPRTSPPPPPPHPTTATTTPPANTATTVIATTSTVALPAAAHLVPLPPALTFAPLTAGTASPAKLLHIRNDGDEPLALAGVGARGSAFRVIDDCPQHLAKNESCSAAIVFAPSAAGAQRGELTVHAGGAAAAVALAGTARPNLPIDLGVLDFGSATTDAKRPPYAVRFANGRAIGVDIGKTSVSGPFAAVADRCSGARIAPGGTCDVTLALAATEAGSFRGKLQLGDAQDNVVAFGELAAEATAPRVVEAAAAKIDIVPRQIAFTRTSRTKQDVVLVNHGGKATTVGLAVTGIHFGFVVDTKPCDGKTLSPGESCTFPVTVLPIAFERGSSMRIVVSYDGHTDYATAVSRY